MAYFIHILKAGKESYYVKGGKNLQECRAIALKHLQTYTDKTKGDFAFILRTLPGFPKVVKNEWGKPVVYPVRNRELGWPNPLQHDTTTVQRIMYDDFYKSWVIPAMTYKQKVKLLNRDGSERKFGSRRF